VRVLTRSVICEISESDISIEKSSQTEANEYKLRKAARGILIKRGKIALLNVTTQNYHKLPGGGLEKDENIEDGFKREVKEETGWNCEIVDGDSITIEYRNKSKILQISYIFIAKTIGKSSEQQLDEGEIEEGHDLEWIPIEKIEELISKENPTEYDDKFIHFRDLSIINFYKDKLTEFI